MSNPGFLPPNYLCSLVEKWDTNQLKMLQFVLAEKMAIRLFEFLQPTRDRCRRTRTFISESHGRMDAIQYESPETLQNQMKSRFATPVLANRVVFRASRTIQAYAVADGSIGGTGEVGQTSDCTSIRQKSIRQDQNIGVTQTGLYHRE